MARQQPGDRRIGQAVRPVDVVAVDLEQDVRRLTLGLRQEGLRALQRAQFYRDWDSGYSQQQATRPQTLGYALTEELPCPEGMPATFKLREIGVIRAREMPEVEVILVEDHEPEGPFGAKGVGEAGTLGSTPCIVAAAVDALGEFGVKHIDMMLRPEKLWRIIHGGQK